MTAARASASTLERLRPDGRWGGAATRRPLPAGEQTASLAPSLRARLAQIWWVQAATEARVARSFAIVHESLGRLNADPGLVSLARRAVDDEHRHAALCEEVAGRYAGGVCRPHPQLQTRHPTHPTAASAALRDALFVVGQCALNESFAGAYLSAARRGATTELARAAIRELLEDEIDHARVGWAYLATAPVDLKRGLSEWLVPLTACNLREWRRLDLPEDDSLAAHGVPPRALALAELDEVVSTLLVPGFRHVGLDTRALERWIAAGADTH